MKHTLIYSEDPNFEPIMLGEIEKIHVNDISKLYRVAIDANRRILEIEPYIWKDPRYAYLYALNVIEGRWPEAEEFIKKDPKWAYCYACDVIIKGRWPEAEEFIKKDPEWAYCYACDVIKGRWPEAEEFIKKDPEWAYAYADNVIKDRLFFYSVYGIRLN